MYTLNERCVVSDGAPHRALLQADERISEEIRCHVTQSIGSHLSVSKKEVEVAAAELSSHALAMTKTVQL